MVRQAASNLTDRIERDPRSQPATGKLTRSETSAAPAAYRSGR